MKRPLLLLTALTLLFGAQSLRVLLPSLTFFGRAVLNLSAGQVVVISYTPVALAWLAPLLGQRLGLSGTLRAFGVGLLVCRLVEQFSTTPAVDLWAAFGGLAGFMGLLPLLYARARAEGEAVLPALALGLLLGLSLDTALRGAAGTLDLSWIPGAWSRLIIVGLAGGFALVLWRVASSPVSLAGEPLRTSLPLIGLGPLLFIEWQILQNLGWVSTLTGWPPTLALALVVLANVGALAAAALVLRREWPRSPWWACLPGGLLTAALLVAETPGWISAFGVLVGIGSAGVLLAIMVGAVRQPAPTGSVVSLSLVFGLTLLGLLGLITLYYVSFLVPILPVPRSALAPLVGAGLALCALGAAWQQRPDLGGRVSDWMPVRLGTLLLLAPMALWVAEVTARPLAKPSGGSVRVMTYNIHAAFGMNGRLDVDAVAQVIRDSGAEVVGLQELSRGWLINGSTDLLPLLSRRLSMPGAVMGPAADPVGGNALLSQYPILAGGHGDLPQLDSLVGRGYVWAQIDWGAGEPLLVMDTHLATESVEMRLAQITALLNAWAGRPRTVLVGDMNALSGSLEIEMILEAGFVDAWAETGQPERPRIDWIFHTPDLMARDMLVIESPASDHPAYAATIRTRR